MLLRAVLLIFVGQAWAEKPQVSLDPPTPPAQLPSGVEAPDFNYAAVFDVGSTGTRVHIHAYEWQPMECSGRGAAKLLMPGWSMKVKPGLASHWLMNKDSDEAITKVVADYFAPLRAFVESHLRPLDLNNTVYLVQATGGFRYLETRDQKLVLDVVYKVLNQWPGKIKRNWLRVLSGAEEGAYSWLALNQLARRFFDPFEHVALHPGVQGQVRRDDPLPGCWLKDNWRAEAEGTAGRRVKKRVGMVEVGGASAQVALEPPKALRDELLNELHPLDLTRRSPILLRHPRGQGFYVLNFCYENVILQIQSLDGFGRQAALQKFLRHQAAEKHAHEGEDFEVQCLPPDARIPVTLNDGQMIIIEEGNATQTNTMRNVAFARGVEQSSAAMCRQTVRSFLKLCDTPPVPFAVDPTYRLYATENFFYFNQYVANAEDSRFSAADWWSRAEDICSATSVELIRTRVHAETEYEKLESACFGLVFLSEFLKTVVQVPHDQIMKAVTAVKDLDTGFVVGAMLTELPLMVREVQKDEMLQLSMAGHREEF